jgi:hypothetical protein
VPTHRRTSFLAGISDAQDAKGSGRKGSKAVTKVADIGWKAFRRLTMPFPGARRSSGTWRPNFRLNHTSEPHSCWVLRVRPIRLGMRALIWLTNGESVVIFNTGSGVKYLEAFE